MSDLATLQASPDAMAFWQDAQQYLRNRLYAAALTSYRGLVQQFPQVPQLWSELSAAASGELDFELANQAAGRAAELAAADVATLVAVGKQYCSLRRLQKTTDCFRAAVAADPGSVHARLTLAAWLERNGRMDEAWECIEACLSRQPRNGRALYYKALLLHRKGLSDQAETALRDLLKSDPSLPAEGQFNIHHLLAVVQDALGRYPEALNSLSRAKMIQRQTADASLLEQTYDKLAHERRILLTQLKPETIRRWREEAESAPCAHPLALLGGAPRSGTTLIEQVLGAHPEILVFDEPISFAKEMMDTLHPGETVDFRSLDEMLAADRAQSIARYFKSLLRETDEKPGAKLLLDKNPSSTGALHFWLRLFPQSKVIIALRDPRDIVISCYFQSIPLNATSVNFLSLERTARFYSNCMDVWLRLRDLGGFDWIESRYEDMVANLEAEGKRVTNFLGLPWHECQTKFYEKARGQFLNAPTYNDVTKPLYNRAVGRWRHYADAMTPLKPALEPYLSAFNYKW